jgi:hypothetical protein
MDDPPTFNRRLGTIAHKINTATYQGQLTDNGKIWYHEKYYRSTFSWLEAVKDDYYYDHPDACRPRVITAHERMIELMKKKEKVKKPIKPPIKRVSSRGNLLALIEEDFTEYNEEVNSDNVNSYDNVNSDNNVNSDDDVNSDEEFDFEGFLHNSLHHGICNKKFI